MFRRINRTLANHNVGFPFKDRADKLGDVRAVILVVRVGVDDDVRPKMQAGVQPGHKAACQPLVALEADNVVHPKAPRLRHGAVAAAVVDDQGFNLINAVNLPGQVFQRHMERFFLIIAGNLDNQFHIHEPLSRG